MQFKQLCFHRLAPGSWRTLCAFAFIGAAPALAQQHVQSAAPANTLTAAATPAIEATEETASPGGTEARALSPAHSHTTLPTEILLPAAPARENPAAPLVRDAAPVPTAAAAPTTHTDIIRLVRERLARLMPSAAENATDLAAARSFYDAHDAGAVWTTPEWLSPRGVIALEELRRAEDYGLDGSGWPLPSATAFASPEQQADAEGQLALAISAYARQARGGRVAPASISRMIEMRPPETDAVAALRTIVSAADAGEALRQLHPQHPGFQHLVKALAVNRAQPTSADAVQRILVNLERWRWMPAELGPVHVVNNVPEQLTRVVRGREVVLTERIVVGKPSSPTPSFSADMKYVIFHPSWGVPEGIKKNELGPMLRRASASSSAFDLFESGGRASASLARHQLRVTRNGQEINPDSVDWNRANVAEFQFTQPPSVKNVLGVVKFRFPNRFDVYMHDTSERHLFAQSTRAYSHGCMRVQNPLKLAEVVLANDKGWSADRIHGFVARGATSDITLDKPLPVHVTYFTASADPDGKLALHGDLYGWDARVASALTGKPVALASQPVASATSRGATPRRTAARGSERQTSSESAFAPFSGLSAN